MKKQTNFILAMAVLLFSSQLMLGQNFSYLIGERASNLDSSLESKDYYHITTDRTGRGTYSYWWNYRTKKCVSARIKNNRVKSVRHTDAADCGKPNNGSYSNYYRRNHKTRHYGDSDYGDSKETKYAFERGFSDGLYHKAYHNIWKYKDTPRHHDAYSHGYEKGVSERGDRTYYHSGRGGFSNYVQVQDLVDTDALWAYEELRQRGFTEQSKDSKGESTYRVWFNKHTEQCVKTTSRNRKISSLVKSTHCINDFSY